MNVKKLNLVKYAGEYWVTLADFTQTRDTEGYSDHSSVKSAIRTFVVKKDPDKYIAFRGEIQIKNIIQENKDNSLFYPEDFNGHTRTALIHWDMLQELDNRFKLSKSYKAEYPQFLDEAEELIEEESKKQVTNTEMVTERSAMLRYLRNEKSKLDREIDIRQKNLDKINAAIIAMESLELEL